MKKITLTKREGYDLSAVLATTLREKAENLDFKEIIGVQKVVNSLVDGVKDYSEKFDALNKQKNTLVENANKKIVAYRRDLAEKSKKDSKLDESYKQKVEDFVNEMLEDAKREIEETISPEFKKLYEELGKTDISIELEDDKHKMTISLFEKFAKEYYTDKKAMVETYEKFTV